MSRYVTLGADRQGQIYGLELNPDGTWRRNPLGYTTNCAVIRPVTKEDYEYYTEDPQSAKEIWQSAVAADQTELGLEAWFDQYAGYDSPFDLSDVYELLDDDGNPTVKPFGDSGRNDGTSKFKVFAKEKIMEATGLGGDDIYEWEASGSFPPDEPFVVEFAPRELLDEYYASLREATHGKWPEEGTP